MYIIEGPRKIDLLKIVRIKATVKNCIGCNENFYNGNNKFGINRCWLLDSARVVRRKEVGINDVPPWNWQPVVAVPQCYRKRGYVYVKPHQTC